jgi:hypothetical protein
VWMHTLEFSSLFENFKNYDRVIGLLITEEYAAVRAVSIEKQFFIFCLIL